MNDTWEGAIDNAMKAADAIFGSPPRPEPVAWAKVQRVAANIRANLDSLPSIASVWADDLDEALAHPSVPPHRVMRVCLKEVE